MQDLNSAASQLSVSLTRGREMIPCAFIFSSVGPRDQRDDEKKTHKKLPLL